jgi:alanyl-tRNA synthetase
MTERLYYTDSYLRDFAAAVVGSSPDGSTVYLDRTAFYPTSGGQPYDTGIIAGTPVLEVVDEGELIAHRLAAPLSTADVECSIDWQRRFDHMQQHTGQHLLSAVFEEALGLDTVSFHLGQESSTIDLEGLGLDASMIRGVEARANQIVCENRPVTVHFEQAAEAHGLRKPSEREGTLRIVTIETLDRNACGGTHVRSTGEIGAILIRKLEKVRQTVRVEFLCGARAVSRARADYEALSRVAELFSAGLDEIPALAEAQLETARAADKVRRKLQLELAAYRGRELYKGTPPDSQGLRRYQHRAASGSAEELGALARSFTAQPQTVFLAALENPPSLIYAVSEDAGIDAGQVVKQALAEAGGRGGGNARFGQGSVPDLARLEAVIARLAVI